MFSFLIGLVGAIIALVGWFMLQSIILLIIGTILYIVETAMEWKELNAGAKCLDVIIFVFGSIIAFFCTSAPWYVGGMIAISIYSLVMALIGLRYVLKFFF